LDEVAACDNRASFIDRLTGEEVYIELDPLSETRAGWDRVSALVWCDIEILCEEQASQHPERQAYEPTSDALPRIQRQIFVDPNSRMIVGFESYRMFESGGPGWALLAQVVVQDEWEGEREQWTYIEASMYPIGGGRYIDRGGFFDANGCGLRVPDHVQLPAVDSAGQ
jgi:hypothetical protein